jgi:predicted PurR-regulated permease PerM
LLFIFIALIFAALIDPFAVYLQEKKIPRGLAVVVIYIIVFGLLALIISALSPIFTRDVPQFFSNFNNYLEYIQEHDVIKRIFSVLEPFSSQTATSAVTLDVSPSAVVPTTALTGLFSTVTGVFGSIFSFILVLVMTFYMVVHDDPLRKILRSVIPEQHVPYVSQLFTKIRDKLGAWLRGQLMLSCLIGLLVFIGLTLLGVPYAAVLGLLAALLEFIPYIGPIFAAVPALLIAVSQGGIVMVILVLVMYLVVQQFENHILVPKVMQHAVGLNPIFSIIAILVGAKLAGVPGALLAIPVATALSVFLQEGLPKKIES